MTAKNVDTAGRDEREQRSVARLVNSVFAEDDPQALNAADWQRLRSAMVMRLRRRALWRRGLFAAAFAGAVGMVFLAVSREHGTESGQTGLSVGAKEPPLTYLVQGQTGKNVGFVHGERGVGTSLDFSDGSRLHFEPQSVGRVLSSTPDGAGVLVENGQAQFQIKHRLTTAWTIYAGPYTVRVTGTAFALAWSANDRTLQLNMTEGSVLIQGPLMDPGVRLIAGQTLRARADGEKIEVTGTGTPSASAIASVTAVDPPDSSVAQAAKERWLASPPANRSKRSRTRRPSARAAALAVSDRSVEHDSAAPPPPPPHPAVTSETWAQRVAAGEFEAVLASAKAEGIQKSLTERPLADLFALADAARYAGEHRLAKQAFLKVRARFPQAAEARTAAFLLGRLSEQDEARAAAVEWFDRYLEEAPSGPYAGLAFGHKMLLVGQTEGHPDVEALARQYLEHYPDGPYATAARDLLKNP